MPVYRYRSVEDMPPPWRASDDPANLRLVAQMMTLYRRLTKERDKGPRVQRFRSLAEANATGTDPYRREQSASPSKNLS